MNDYSEVAHISANTEDSHFCNPNRQKAKQTTETNQNKQSTEFCKGGDSLGMFDIAFYQPSLLPSL